MFPNGLCADDISRNLAMRWQMNWSKSNILKEDGLCDMVQGSSNKEQSGTVKS